MATFFYICFSYWSGHKLIYILKGKINSLHQSVFQFLSRNRNRNSNSVACASHTVGLFELCHTNSMNNKAPSPPPGQNRSRAGFCVAWALGCRNPLRKGFPKLSRVRKNVIRAGNAPRDRKSKSIHIIKL